MKAKCLYSLILLMLIGLTGQAFGTSMDGAFGTRDRYKGATKLGTPPDAEMFKKMRGDTRNLQNLGDSSLVDQGKRSLQSSEQGSFLQDAEKKKLDAKNRYQINANNTMLKDSLKMEENPMSKTGGRPGGTSEKSENIVVKKSCMEGVDFNVDVGVELILECKEEEYDSPYRYERRIVDIPGDTVYQSVPGNLKFDIKWKRRRFGLHIRTDARGWRNYLSQYLGIPIEEIDPEISFPHGARGFGGTHWVAKKTAAFNKYRVIYKYRWKDKLKRFKENGEYWQVVTKGMEQLADSNECFETSRRCLKSGVKTFFGKYRVTRPCWYEKISYQCKSKPKGGCDHLVKQGCRLKDSSCEYRIGSICLKWKRNYECGGKRKRLSYSLSDSPIYCLGGDCHEPVLEENQDFANVAYLAALNEAKKDCDKTSNGTCKQPITIFPGVRHYCRKIITGFINCCTSMKGWGKNVNICKCDGAEKGLAMKRDKGLCHPVGTYCSSRDPIFNSCLEKKTGFCCFNSKLARVFHEQGRAQIGRGWGTASSPDCEPFTLSEFQRLDFSKFDMEELFDALLVKGKNKSKSKNAMSFPKLRDNEMPAKQKQRANERQKGGF